MLRPLVTFSLLMLMSVQALADVSLATIRNMTAALETNRLLGGMSLKCVSYMVEAETVRTLDVGFFEIHGQGCPGDPLTHPRIVSLRLLKQTGRIFRYDTPNDSYVPLR